MISTARLKRIAFVTACTATIAVWVGYAPVSAAPTSNASSRAVSAVTSSAKLTTLPIILFHYVENVANPRDIMRKQLAITPAILRMQLNTLKKNAYEPVFVSDIPTLLAHPDGKKHVALTFDDGYRDFYTDAYPILKEFQMKSTLYAVNDFLDKPDYLTKDQLKEIAASGLVEIGAHTLDHVSLPSQKPAEIIRQIAESKKGLEQETGKPVKTFAYPYGHYNVAVIKATKAAGFETAVTVDPGVQLSPKNLFTLVRIRAGMFLGRNMLSALKPRVTKTKTKAAPVKMTGASTK